MTCVQVNPIVAADVCDKLLEACARLAEADLAVQVAHCMRGLGIPVGYVAHGCVLRALCMAGNHEVSFRLGQLNWLAAAAQYNACTLTCLSLQCNATMYVPVHRKHRPLSPLFGRANMYWGS